MKEFKAARIHNYGGAEVVRVENTALPEPQAGELAVRVHAAGVNPVDWKIRAGYLQQMMPLPLPFTLGGDFSGVVEAVGDGVEGFRVGDEIYGQAAVFTGGSGSFAESAIVKTGNMAAKPRRLSHTEAGALPLVGVSALQALTEHLRVSAGQKILIHGGAGGIGSIAIQIAKHLGAYVATTVSAKDVDHVKRLGADEVIDRKSLNFEDVVRDFDAALDTVGGDTYARSFKVLKRGGRLVSLLEPPREDLMNDYGVEASVMFTQVTTDRLAKLAELVDKGVVKVNVEKTYPLGQAGEALQQLETESPRGKVVLEMV